MLPLGRRHGQGHAGDTATSPRTRLRRALLLPYSPCILPTRVAERRRVVLLLSYPTSSGQEGHSPRRAPLRARGAPQHRPGLRMLRGLVAGAGAVCCGSKMTRVWRGACAAQPCGGRGQTDDPMPGHLAARRRGRATLRGGGEGGGVGEGVEKIREHPVDLPRAARGRLSAHARLVQTRRARMAREHAAPVNVRPLARHGPRARRGPPSPVRRQPPPPTRRLSPAVRHVARSLHASGPRGLE